MSKPEIELLGSKAMMKALEEGARRFPQETKIIVKNNAEKGKEIAQRTAPKKTGYLRENIVTKYPRAFEGWIISGAMYSGYVNYGTRFQAAQPYFTNMWDIVVSNLERELKALGRRVF